MKNILKSLLAIAFVATLSSYANAQTATRLCFQTGTSTTSCQPVTTANPLPTTASLSASALSVTVVNTAASPVIVSTANGFGGGGSTGNVTVTNTAAVPVIVSNPNGLGGSGAVWGNVANGGAANKPPVVIGGTIDGSATGAVGNWLVGAGGSGLVNIATGGVVDGGIIGVGALGDGAGATGSNSLISITKQLHLDMTASIPAGTNAIGSVTCTNCTGSAGPFNVTITNTPAVTLAATNVTVTNTVTVGAHNVSITNTPAVTNTLATTGGWTPLLLNNLLTTVNAIKTTSGQLAKLFCYNPNATVAYVQVWNLTTGAVTVGSTTPTNSYGIPATTSAGFAMSTTGDEYSTAISVAATTAAKGGTPPTTGVDCNASYN